MRLLRTLLVPFVLVAAALLQTALAQEARNLVVYPFTSQETLLGAAVAERVASALEDRLEVLGPEATPLFVPFMATDEGFISPLVFLTPPYGVASLAGAELLRGSFGADAALSGEVFVRDTRLELRLFVATPEGVQVYLFRASQASPGRLAAQAVRALEEALALPAAPVEATEEATAIDLSTAYADYVRALVLIGAGFAGDAADALEQALEDAPADDEAAWRALLEEIRRVEAGEEAADPILNAALALSLSQVSEARAEEAFAALAERSSLPGIALWTALLSRSQDLAAPEEADEAFAAAATYPYGLAVEALQLATRAPERARDSLERLGAADMAATLVASLAARELGDLGLEAALTERLGRLAPTLVYAFERRSFIAFEEDDALAAARALVVATRLVPDSDLYWTNLGWAYYLLGFLERSEAASHQAIALDDTQVVAWYNLGLVETVTGRLAEALLSYDAALRRDDGVNVEAVEDLEAALELYPDEPGVHFSLASLYAAQGRRQEAVRQFERFLERGSDPELLGEAERRIQVLSAPPPAITLTAARLSLRPAGEAETAFRRGDRLFVALELGTDGFELPREVALELRLLDETGEAVAERRTRRELPPGAVAVRVDDLGLNLPAELPEGLYTLEVSATASEDREAQAGLSVELRGEASLARQLMSRGISLRSLDAAAPFMSAQEARQEDADARLLAALQAELHETAELAEEVLPEVERGRFEGLGGGELFRESDEAALRDFLRFVVAQEGFMESTLTFVDAYAQWALEGAPEE